MGKASTLTERFKGVTSLISAVSGLLVALSEFLPHLNNPIDALKTHWGAAILSGSLIVLALLLGHGHILQWLSPRSQLLKKEAVSIGHRYFVGRDEDLDHLVRLIADWPLIWLQGESGSGKSTLLASGLVPKLQSDPLHLPLLIEYWQADWENGPRQSLANALMHSLDDSLRQSLQITKPIHPENALALVGSIADITGRTPVLLFDQFDDYFSRHRQRFVNSANGRVITTAELIAANTFWRDIASLLHGKLRCLFASRSEAAWAFEVVRFQEPRILLLTRLDRAVAEDLLTQITSGEAVARPGNGLAFLRERLIDDLAPRGTVLPIQMRLAFKALSHLPQLTFEEYVRVGRLPGLEATHVKIEIANAAHASGLDFDAVLQLLLTMVGSTPPPKTVPRTREQLIAALPETARSDSALALILAALQASELVRPAVATEIGEDIWQLDHDFFCEVLLELDRGRRKWQLVLQSSAAGFKAAAGLFERWSRLLAPTLQIRLLYERFWGGSNFRYGTASTFAALSTSRLAINTLTGLLAIVMTAAILQSQAMDQAAAESMLRRFETSDDAAALFAIAQETPAHQRAFLRLLLQTSANNVDTCCRASVSVEKRA